MPMNPISRTYAADSTGAQTAFGIDWRDAPTGLSYQVVFDSGASGSVTVDTTLDNLNDPSGSVTPVWTSSSAITTTTLSSVPSPAQFIRVTIGSLSGGTLTFKILQGAPDGGGSSSGGGGGGGAVTIADGADVAEGAIADAAATAGGTGTISAKLRRLTAQLPAALGQTTMSASMSVAIASNQSSVPVTPATDSYASSVTITRPANTTAYSAGAVIGGVSTAVLTFSTIGPAAGAQLMVTSVLFNINDSAVISGETSYNLALYSASPGSAYTDGAIWDLPSGDRTSYLGTIQLGTPADLGSTLSVAADIINKQITAASGTLYGYLITVGAYTPTPGRVYVPSIHTIAV